MVTNQNKYQNRKRVIMKKLRKLKNLKKKVCPASKQPVGLNGIPKTQKFEHPRDATYTYNAV